MKYLAILVLAFLPDLESDIASAKHQLDLARVAITEAETRIDAAEAVLDGIVTTPPPAPLTNPILLMSMDDATGSDDSGTGNDMMVVGDPTSDGEWVDFSNDRFTRPSANMIGAFPSLGAQEFSITAWVSLDVISDIKPIATKMGHNLRGWKLAVQADGHVAWENWPEGATSPEAVNGVGVLEIEVPTHVALTRDGTGLTTIYLDGVQDVAGMTGIPRDNTEPLNVGAYDWSSGYQRYFNGRMSGFAIYDQALLADEVFRLAEDVPTTPAPPVIPPPVIPPPVVPPPTGDCVLIDYPKPGAANTGPTGALTPSGTINVTTDGAIIENVDVSGMIYVTANNVTIRNFRVRGGGWYNVQLASGFQNLRLEDGELYESNSAAILADSFTATRLNIHDIGSDGIKTGGPCTIEDSWFHHLGTDPLAHADGVQIRYGHDITIQHNSFDMPWPTQPGYLSNACVLADANLGQTVRVNIIENWLNGGNYSVYIDDNGGAGGQPQDCQIVGNNFGRDYQYGVFVNQGIGTIVTGNAWEDTGECMDIND